MWSTRRNGVLIYTLQYSTMVICGRTYVRTVSGLTYNTTVQCGVVLLSVNSCVDLFFNIEDGGGGGGGGGVSNVQAQQINSGPCV